MVQLPREYKDTTPTWLPLVVGGVFSTVGFFVFCFGIAAVLLGATFQSMFVPLGLGAGFLFIGITCLIQLHWNYVRQTIHCAPAAFSVLSESKRRGTRREEYRWGEVTSTKYEHTLRRQKGGSKRIVGSFRAETSRGRAFEVDHNQSDFQELVTVFNEQTSHLPYIWARDSNFAGTVMWASSAKPEYNKIPRPPQAIPPPLPGSLPPPLPPLN